MCFPLIYRSLLSENSLTSFTVIFRSSVEIIQGTKKNRDRGRETKKKKEQKNKSHHQNKFF